MHEKDYNYFGDVNPTWQIEGFDFTARKDPDFCCKKLYDDLLYYFFYKENRMLKYGIDSAEIVEKHNGQVGTSYQINVYCDTRIFVITADYIGPSTWWCRANDMTQLDIVKKSRVLGGHIMWPNTYSINCARGTARGAFDRIDVTLCLLKLFYHIIDNPCFGKFINLCQKEYYMDYISEKDTRRLERIFKAFVGSREWLKLFEWKGFCKFFYLDNSFVKNGEIILLDECVFPITKPSMIYRDNCINAIVERENIIR